MLDHPRVDAEPEPAGQRRPVGRARQDVQRGRAVGEVDGAVGEDGDRVQARALGQLAHLAVHVDPGRGDHGGADVRAPGGAFQRGPPLTGPVAAALGAFAELPDAALDRGLHGGQHRGLAGVGTPVPLHRGEELGLRHARGDAQAFHRGEVGVAQPLVPGVQIGPVLRPDPGLRRPHVVAEFRRVRQGGRGVPGRSLRAVAVRGERVRQARVEAEAGEVRVPAAGQLLVEARLPYVDRGTEAHRQPVGGGGEGHVDVQSDRVRPAALGVGEQLGIADPVVGLLVQLLTGGAARGDGVFPGRLRGRRVDGGRERAGDGAGHPAVPALLAHGTGRRPQGRHQLQAVDGARTARGEDPGRVVAQDLGEPGRGQVLRTGPGAGSSAPKDSTASCTHRRRPSAAGR